MKSAVLIYSTDNYYSPEGKKELVVCFALDEDGDRLNIVIPKAFSLPEETAIRGQVLKILMERQFQKRYIRCEFDPRDGEVRLGIDIILEDNQLSGSDLLMHLEILLTEIEEIYQQVEPLLHIESQVQKLEALYQQDIDSSREINTASESNISHGDRPGKAKDKDIASSTIYSDAKNDLLEDFFEVNLKPEQKEFLNRLTNANFELKRTGPKKQTIRIRKDGYDYGYINKKTMAKGFFGYRFNVSPLLSNSRGSDNCPSSFVGEKDEKTLEAALELYFEEKYGFYDGWCLEHNKSRGAFYVTITDLESAEIIVGLG